MVLKVLSIIAMLLMAVSNAQAGVRVNTTCQKNLADGRILVEDFATLPSQTSTFKVLKFKAVRKDGEWSHGPCVLDAKR